LNCETARTLTHPYIDGELDLTQSLEIEGHLAECAACNHAYQSQQVLRQALSAGPLYYRAPAGLHKRVMTTVRQENRSTAPRSLPRSWLGVAAALVLIAVIGWGLTRNQALSTQRDLVADEVLSSSMRSLIAGPLIDIQSSDQHTVKPWFAGKLDFSPSVPDFAGQGFPLAGGRLDYVDNRPVAALVYRHQQHVINLYTWPTPGSTNPSVQEQKRQGYQLFGWTQDGMTCWAVSDMDAGELRQFVQLMRQS
jgi:anti-sigma factor RsiW